MTFFAILLLAVGLAMDAFAVSVCKGLKMRKINYLHTTIIALFFGGFQALMPLIGWFLGKQFAKAIEAYDHWIAFVLLGFIGGKTVFEAIKERNETVSREEEQRLDIRELFMLAIATSIDALAAGVTLSFFKVNIPFAIAVIGIVTFIISFVGVAIGNRFGASFKTKAEIVGGTVLILLGVYILLKDLM
ncbi:MAG: manganese efflux pump [Ruminococcus sp.]|nr:manganese efflux pump [Ruminococcus sp.]